jgi:hypothetical protein
MKCQLTYLPLATDNVKEGELSTLVEGDQKEVLDMVGDIYSTQNDNGQQFRLHVELLSSNNYS